MGWLLWQAREHFPIPSFLVDQIRPIFVFLPGASGGILVEWLQGSCAERHRERFSFKRLLCVSQQTREIVAAQSTCAKGW